MAPDPQGTHAAGLAENPNLAPAIPHPDGPYDRSSLRGDFLVMIPEQTVEDYLRRHPKDRKCEFIDGTVYLHTSAIDEEEPAEFYDRSSLRGDFLVMIPHQTEEDYLQLCPEGKFCELIDGVVCMHAAAEKQHQFNVSLLSFVLQGFTTVREAGIVLLGPSALRIGPDRYFEPDIFVMPNAATAQADPIYWHPPALLVVEVLSRTTRDHDLREKGAIYREAGIIDVWFIDHRDRAVIVQRPTADGVETREVKSGSLHPTGLPGFWFDVAWLWAEPRPNLMHCLDRILAGPPE